ncbi:MAG: HAMP domain-containing histidine kinase [Verrucomicrobiae bacterium]|nr:HAMP domain-containing histidine kinase [Verrucomicrobiae bacterium]
MLPDAHGPPPRRYALLALALVLPSLGLAGIAGWALRADRRAAEADLRIRSERMAWNILAAVTNAWTAGRDGRGEVHELKLESDGTLAWPRTGVWPPVPVEVIRGMSEPVRTVWRRAEAALAMGNGNTALEELRVVEVEGQGDEGPPGGTPASTERGRPTVPEASVPIHLDLLRAQALAAVGESAAAVEAARRVLVTSTTEARMESGLSVREVALELLVGLIEADGGFFPDAWRDNGALAVRDVVDVPSTPVSEEALTRLRVWLGERSRIGSMPGEFEKVEAPLRQRDWARRSFEAIQAKRTGLRGLRADGTGGLEETAVLAWELDRHLWIGVRSQDPAGIAGSGLGSGGETREPAHPYRARRWVDVVEGVRTALRADDPHGHFGFSVDLQGRDFSVHHQEPSDVTARALTAATASGPGNLLLKVAVALVDRDSAFAGQRRRERVLGGIVLAGVGISVLAAGLTWRVLVRQHRLGVQKSNFVASVSHELRAPLASVRVLADNLEQDRVSDAGRKQATLKLIGRECRRLGMLVDNVLDLSRIERGRKRIEPEPTDVLALVQETVRWAGVGAEERGVRVRLELGRAPEGWVATLDGAAVQQVLTNLLDNAVKHAPHGSGVTVGLEVDSMAIRLTVADAGPGIPGSEREKVFDPFHRLGSELRREQPGVGIGLAIVKHLVEAHGGRVWVETVEPTGARFVVRLPNRPEGLPG